VGFLLATPLTSAEITVGKVVGAAAPVLMAAAACLLPAGALAVATLSPVAVASWLVGFTWLAIAAVLGSALGTACALLLQKEQHAQLLPLLGVLLIQGLKLWTGLALFARLGHDIWMMPLPLYAWWMLPLYLLEAGLAVAACRLTAALLTWRRSRDILFATES
jgi:hypothetical protein